MRPAPPIDRTAVDVRVVTQDGVQARDPADLKELLRGPDLVWVDVPQWDEAAAAALVEPLGLHAGAVRECAERNPLPKVHLYPDHVFVVLHAPEAGHHGHVHYIELDQFVGPNWLVTVHGPLGTGVDPTAAADGDPGGAAPARVRAAARRLRGCAVLRAGHRADRTAAGLPVDAHPGGVGLEQTVMAGHLGNAEEFLEELFRARHGLLAARDDGGAGPRGVRADGTRGASSASTTPSCCTTPRTSSAASRSMADTQREYLQGVIEFYQARTNTKMTIAAERLAVIAAVTLPVTAISSVMGMNVIVNDETHWGWLGVLLAGMLVMSVALLIWARRQGWW